VALFLPDRLLGERGKLGCDHLNNLRRPSAPR
jgi:hypothetical protein